MKRYLCLLLAAPALAIVVIWGCSSDKKSEKPQTTTTPSSGGETAATSSGERVALEAKGKGDLKGKVIYDGDPPKPASLANSDLFKKLGEPDHSRCLMGDMADPTWRVGSDKGVQNVVVWLRAPSGKYFDVPEDQRHVEKVVELKQPYCAFEPHVTVVFPFFYNPKTKKHEKTGEKLVAINNAPMNHNTAYKGHTTTGDNKNLKPNETLAMNVEIGKKPGSEDRIDIRCDIHKWMSAYAYAFDHPYAAVTNEHGEFDIKNAPAAEVEVWYWHESFDKPKKLKSMTLKSGENSAGEIPVKKS
jgi:hypothetical protein